MVVITRPRFSQVWHQLAFILAASLSFIPRAHPMWLGPVGIEAQDFAECPSQQQTFGSISLGHAGDVWGVSCRAAPPFVRLSECYWSGFQNEYSKSINFECKENHVITQIEKLYDQDVVDLRLNFQCCQAEGVVTEACKVTQEEFDSNRQLHLTVPENFYLVGWTSHHYNPGRGHQFKLCKLKKTNS